MSHLFTIAFTSFLWAAALLYCFAFHVIEPRSAQAASSDYVTQLSENLPSPPVVLRRHK